MSHDSWLLNRDLRLYEQAVKDEGITGIRKPPSWTVKEQMMVPACLELFNYAERIKADSRARESTRCFINVINMLPTSSRPDLRAKPLASAEAGDPALTHRSGRSI